MKQKDVDVPKLVEQIQQNIYDRKNKKKYSTKNTNIKPS